MNVSILHSSQSPISVAPQEVALLRSGQAGLITRVASRALDLIKAVFFATLAVVLIPLYPIAPKRYADLTGYLKREAPGEVIPPSSEIEPSKTAHSKPVQMILDHPKTFLAVAAVGLIALGCAYYYVNNKEAVHTIFKQALAPAAPAAPKTTTTSFFTSTADRVNKAAEKVVSNPPPVVTAPKVVENVVPKVVENAPPVIEKTVPKVIENTIKTPVNVPKASPPPVSNTFFPDAPKVEPSIMEWGLESANNLMVNLGVKEAPKEPTFTEWASEYASLVFKTAAENSTTLLAVGGLIGAAATVAVVGRAILSRGARGLDAPVNASSARAESDMSKRSTNQKKQQNPQTGSPRKNKSKSKSSRGTNHPTPKTEDTSAQPQKEEEKKGGNVQQRINQLNNPFQSNPSNQGQPQGKGGNQKPLNHDKPTQPAPEKNVSLPPPKVITPKDKFLTVGRANVPPPPPIISDIPPPPAPPEEWEKNLENIQKSWEKRQKKKQPKKGIDQPANEIFSQPNPADQESEAQKPAPQKGGSRFNLLSPSMKVTAQGIAKGVTNLRHAFTARKEGVTNSLAESESESEDPDFGPADDTHSEEQQTKSSQKPSVKPAEKSRYSSMDNDNKESSSQKKTSVNPAEKSRYSSMYEDKETPPINSSASKVPLPNKPGQATLGRGFAQLKSAQLPRPQRNAEKSPLPEKQRGIGTAMFENTKSRTPVGSIFASAPVQSPVKDEEWDPS